MISIVVPFYNESTGVGIFFEAITNSIKELQKFDFEIICVDDGSKDDTLEFLRQLPDKDSRFQTIELSRNFGKEAALTAGLDLARGDALIFMDADLQHPPELIATMIDEWQNGYDMVLAKQKPNILTGSFFRRKASESFYKLHNQISSTNIPQDIGDFRLVNRTVITALKKLTEQQRFMKGLFAWIGFKTKTIEYDPQKRSSGESKFSSWKLWNFALDGITSFSTAPLRVWTYIGLFIAALTMVYAIYIIGRTIVIGVDVPGYASLLVAILFLGSIQLISIGVLGEYIGRIYLESKQRPVYLIRQIYAS